MGTAVVIPALRPDDALIELVESLSASPTQAIVIVDDGSGAEFAATFRACAAMPRVTVLYHAVNRGKGAALKTAFDHVVSDDQQFQGVVTADADGQHTFEDILMVCAVLEANPGSLILGSRSFDGHVPFRSRFGNGLTRVLTKFLVGQKLMDTQTGLRGIPIGLLPDLLKIRTTGYEFELDVLIAMKHLSVAIVERPITTVYRNGNSNSHFNPLLDSLRIYFVLLRFSAVSVLSAVIDNLVFIAAYHLSANIAGSQVIARAVSVLFNYNAGRHAVFQAKQRHVTVFPKYLLLVLVSGTVSYALIRLITSLLPVPVVAAKLIAETLLFFANFAIQRDFIFVSRD